MRNYIIRRNTNKADDFFGDVFNDFFKPVFYDEKADGMKTDIKELDNSYEMDVELPGFDKKDINVSYNDGYVTVSANKEEKQEEEKDGKKYTFLLNFAGQDVRMAVPEGLDLVSGACVRGESVLKNRQVMIVER